MSTNNRQLRKIRKRHAPANLCVQTKTGGLNDQGYSNGLSRADNYFFSNTLGQDFSDVKIHTGADAHAAAQSIRAKAFTHKNHIVFAEGQYQPGTPKGKKLLAHELTHVAQQRRSATPAIQRSIEVENPAVNIPNPTGKGLVQTNAKTVADYLNKLCPSGAPTVAAGGQVSLGTAKFCEPGFLPNIYYDTGQWLPSHAAASSTPTACTCFCDLIASKNKFRIKIDDGARPHSNFDDDLKAETPSSGGSGSEAVVISPNSQASFGAATASGKLSPMDPWIVLGHELCGHGWLANRGEHGPDHVPPRGYGGHQLTVERENLIRDEQGVERRATFRQPFCGESFEFKTGAAITDEKSVTWKHLPKCEAWRTEYNKLNKTSFTVKDTIPANPKEKLPKLP